MFTLKIFHDTGTVKLAMDQLGVFKALGDETRYVLYQELARATSALSVGDLADRLELHVNTVRLHLERLRENGLVEVAVVRRGTVGRPQHVYTLVPGAPSFGFDLPSHTLLAGLLATMAERLGASGEDAVEIGQGWGQEAGRKSRSRGYLAALIGELRRLGFDPAVDEQRAETTVAFLQCPFRELAEAYPELVCNLHRGICIGVVESVGGGTVEDFATLYDHDPCRVTVAAV